MGHVVLGSNTPIGSSIVRLLASVKAKDIIAASPSGSLPKGVDPKRVEPKFADIIDPYSLSDLFQEGDIVYNCQIVSDERVKKEDAELYNNIGFVNLLGVATSEKVGKIVCAFPQALGFKLPEVATEEDYGKPKTPTQKTLREALSIAKKYMNAEPFGWKQKTIERFTESAVSTANFVPETDDEDDGSEEESQKDDQSSGPKSSGGPSMPSSSGPKMQNSSGPSLGGGPKMPNTSSGPQMPNSSGPSLGGGPNSGPKLGGPSLGPNSTSGPTLGKTDDEADETSEEETTESEIPANQAENDKNQAHEEVIEPEPEEEPYEPVPLIIARIAKLFGPFDPDLTDKFCRSIRLQRLEITGSIDKEITWINPIDAGRAMIILGDLKVDGKSGEYLVNGFTASPMEILNKLDEINHSNLEINHKNLFLDRIKHYFRQLVNAVGLNLQDDFYYHLSINTYQVFDDSKMKEEYGWTPKFGLEKTAKEAINWFTAHQL